MAHSPGDLDGSAPSPATVALPGGPLKVYPSTLHDNSAADYKHIETFPLASSMGAEVRGLRLDVPLHEAQVADVKAALFRHGMLFFRQQDLSIEDQERITSYLGEFGTDAYTTGIEGHPNVTRLVKEAHTRSKGVFGEGWHTDSPFLPRPPAISILYSVETPPYGGDTMFASLKLALRYLSPAMRTVLSGLRVHMSAARVLSLFTASRAGDMALSVDQEAMLRGSCHPLVRTHPETGEQALYVDHTYAIGIEGMEDAESRALLGFLREHVTEDHLTCRLRWEPKMLVLWDNRLVIHRAFNDYDGHRREHRRTTVQGEVPMSKL